MAARTSMAALIAKTRMLIGDSAGSTQVFTDDEIQTVLDAHEKNIRYEALTPMVTIVSGGAVTWLIWKSKYGDWEDDAEVVDGTYTEITPSVFDAAEGEWTFTTSQKVVFVTGDAYDVHGSAAQLLDYWIAKLKLGVDFAADGGNYSLSQRITALEKMRNAYLAKSWDAGGVGYLERADVHC